MSAPEPRPPKILKPKLHNRKNITNRWLQEEAFSDTYYQNKTGNWLNIRIDVILRIIKVLHALAEKEHSIDYASTSRFHEQSELVIIDIYTLFLEKLKVRNMSREYFSLITDMLTSTENLDTNVATQRRWLFCWAANERDKFRRREVKAPTMGGGAGEEHPDTHDDFSEGDIAADEVDKKKRHLQIKDCAPVIDREGRAVALLHLGDPNGTQNHFLPLQSIVQAIELLEQGKRIARGNIQLVLGYWKYAGARAYLVPQEIIDRAKAGDTESAPAGFLRVNTVLEGGPGHKAGVRTGDFIIDCNGRLLKSYLDLEAVLDTSIGQTITLGIVREGERLNTPVQVQDYAETEPREIYELHESVFHGIPSRIAMTFNIPIDSGVFVASSFGDVSAGSILTKLGHSRIRTLRDLFEAIHRIPHGSRVNAIYMNTKKQEVTVLTNVYTKNLPETYSILKEDIGKIWRSQVDTFDPMDGPNDQLQVPSIAEVDGPHGKDAWQSAHVTVAVYSPIFSPYRFRMPGVLLRTKPVPIVLTTRWAGMTKMATVTVTCANREIHAKIKALKEAYMFIQLSEECLPRSISTSDAIQLGMKSMVSGCIPEDCNSAAQPRPILVGRAFKGYPQSGLKLGDIILSIDGKQIRQLSDLKKYLGTGTTAAEDMSYRSPCRMEKIPNGVWIKSIGGAEVRCIDDIIALLREKQYQEGEKVIVRTIGPTGQELVYQIRTDNKFFPVFEWLPQKGDVPWRLIQHTGSNFNRQIPDGTLDPDLYSYH
ncbi:hypothetical protein Dda_7071 [Drechslerella dactyloides]|uniref:PDZ domain-containing protein n=1 Tax=Drechslerella dactyloides TaxID=74499 RepID=A0AAD6IUA3_DREDA|nr:hypothetical protein Dda_7071 [Drechslerella dactyloides]